jgi:hypothetical protein
MLCHAYACSDRYKDAHAMSATKPEIARPAIPTFLVDSTGTSVGVSNPIPVTQSAVAAQSAEYTATGYGTVIDCSSVGASQFSLQVKGTGASATSWDVRLEGSLDGVSYTPLIQHTENSADGSIISSGTNQMLVRYLRVNVADVTLGPATNLKIVVAYR